NPPLPLGEGRGEGEFLVNLLLRRTRRLDSGRRFWLSVAGSLTAVEQGAKLNASNENDSRTKWGCRNAHPVTPADCRPRRRPGRWLPAVRLSPGDRTRPDRL